MVVAMGTIVAYVFRDHVSQDDKRFGGLKGDMKDISARLTEVSDKMAENHAEILNQFISANQHAQTLAAVADALVPKQ